MIASAGVEPVTNRYSRRVILFQALLTLLLVLLLVWRVDMAEALRRLGAIDLRWGALAGAIFLASRLLQAYRWRLALWHRRGIPFRRLTAIFLVGTLANAVVPLRGGDLLRVQIAGRRLGIPRAELTATVFAVETPLNWVTLALLLIGVLLFVDLPQGATAFVAVAATAFAAAFAGVLLLVRLDRSRSIATRRPVVWLPPPLAEAVAAFSHRFLDGMELLRNARLAALALVTCGVIWLVEGALYWCLARAFGLDLSAAGALVVMVAANLVVSLPLTPGHLGAYEVAVGGIATEVGIRAADAVGFAVGAHLLLILFIVLAGIPAAWALGLSAHDLFGGISLPGRGRRPKEAMSDEG